MSSREMPKVVCVRSLVPKLKNSASSAIWSAVRAARGLDGDGGLDDGARLHLGDLGEGDAEAAAAQSEHGVGLVQLLNPRQQRAQFLELGRAGIGVLEVRDFDQQILALGQELMQRGIEQAN